MTQNNASTRGSHDSAHDRAEYRADFRSYAIGFALAVVLTAVPFVLVGAHLLARATALPVVAVLAIVQVVAHFVFFLHIDLSKSKRDDLQLILFSTLIVILMVSGTIWIIANQHARMM